MTIIASDVVCCLFIAKVRLVTGHDVQRERLVQHVSANPGQTVVFDVAGERVTWRTRWHLHTIPTNGFPLTAQAICPSL